MNYWKIKYIECGEIKYGKTIDKMYLADFHIGSTVYLENNVSIYESAILSLKKC